MKRYQWLTFLILSVSAFLILGGGKDTDIPSTQDDRFSTTIGVLPGSISDVDIHLTQALGYFNEVGLDVRIITADSGAILGDLLNSGAIEFAPFATANVFTARANDVPWRIIATRKDASYFSMIVRSDLKEEVTSVADLKGRTIATTHIGGFLWGYWHHYLREVGLDPERDVNIVATGLASTYDLIETGQIDASLLPPPWDVRLVNQGHAFRLIDPLESEDNRLVLALVTHENVLNERPEVAKRVVEALSRTFEYIQTQRSNPSAIVDIIADNFRPVSYDLLLESVRRFIETTPATPIISRNAYEEELAIFVRAKIVAATPFEEAVHPDFAHIID